MSDAIAKGCRRFDGKVAVVTGAAQGIGRATALRLGSEGATVVVADRAEAQANETRSMVEDLGAEGYVILGDLEQWADNEALMRDAHAIKGRIDVSVHNVGGTIWAKPYHEYPIDQIEKEIQRSLWPTLWACRAVIPYMVEQQSGVIVNVGSVATRGINRMPYSAAKGGIHAITVCLAMELADYNIRVNCAAPGGVDVGQRAIPRGPMPETDQEIGWFQGVMEQTLRDTPMKRMGRPEELAAAIAFLASDDASYITGETVDVSGGGPGMV